MPNKHIVFYSKIDNDWVELRSIQLHFANIVLLGMFLGYSVFQLLGYGVAAISAPLESFQAALSKKIANLKHGGEIPSQAQVNIENNTDNRQITEFNREVMVRRYTDFEENFEVMEQQIREIKIRIKGCENQGRIFKINSKIPIPISK